MLASAASSIKPRAAALEDEAWARFLARCIDQLIVGFVLIAATYGISLPLIRFEPAWGAPLDWLHDGWLGYVLLLGASMIYDITLLAGFGSTPGKWLLGVRVMGPDGAPPSLPAMLKRVAILWSAGLALRVPVLGMIAQVGAGLRLISKGSTLWDSVARLTVERRAVGWPRWVLSLGLLGALALACLATVLPEVGA